VRENSLKEIDNLYGGYFPIRKERPFLAGSKWSKRPFMPSSGMDAVKIIGGALSAAGVAVEEVLV